jgi:hypothetical protein
MSEQMIKDIIDSHLRKSDELHLNRLPSNIEAEMADPNQDKDEEWRTWFAIPSKVTEEEINDFEKQIGRRLPKDYKTFLK